MDRSELTRQTDRVDGRAHNRLRPIRIEPDYLDYAEGSVLIACGKTRVLCAASVEEKVPGWMRDQGRGWVTGEYSMLPRSTHTRSTREVHRHGGLSGRTSEIRRLIGRSLRAVTDLEALGEVTITVDCDVIQADGGTRTASITGGYIALQLALHSLRERGVLAADPIREPVAAISVGIVDGTPALDLCYEEDSAAQVDMNVVMTGGGRLVEVQGTAETEPFSMEELHAMMDLAGGGIRSLVEVQQEAIRTRQTVEFG